MEEVTVKIETQTQAIVGDVNAGATSVAAAAKKARASLHGGAAYVSKRIERLGGGGGGEGGASQKDDFSDYGIGEVYNAASDVEMRMERRERNSNSVCQSAGTQWETSAEVIDKKKTEFDQLSKETGQKIENESRKTGNLVASFNVEVEKLIFKMEEEEKEKQVEEEKRLAGEMVNSFVASLAVETDRAKADREKYVALNAKLESVYQELLQEEDGDGDDVTCSPRGSPCPCPCSPDCSPISSPRSSDNETKGASRSMRSSRSSSISSWSSSDDDGVGGGGRRPDSGSVKIPGVMRTGAQGGGYRDMRDLQDRIDADVEKLRKKLAEVEIKKRLAFERARKLLESKLDQAEKLHLSTLIDQVESVCSKSWESTERLNNELAVLEKALHSWQVGVQTGVIGVAEKKEDLGIEVQRRVQDLATGREKFHAVVAQFEEKSQEAATEIGAQTENALQCLTRTGMGAEMSRRNWEEKLIDLGENVEEISRKVAKEG